MKRLAIISCLISLLMMSACGAKEAINTDRDFGMAQYSMEKQIINPTPPGQRVPEGVRSIEAERMMQAMDDSYYSPTQQNSAKYEVSTEQK